jgi:hypothetical protein
MQKNRCQSCGLLIFVDWERQRLTHEAPECPFFLGVMERAGAQFVSAPGFVDPETGEPVEPADRA